MHTIKIHVHPAPTHDDYDYHLPFYGVVYDKDTYCNNLKELVPTTSEIVLTSNGEPDQRLSLALDLLRQDFKHVRVENKSPCYAKDDALFLDQSFIKLPKKDRNFQDIVEYYLEHYPAMPFVQEGPIVTFRGFVRHNKLMWYHYGRDMPTVDNDEVRTLNQLLDPVFCDLVQCLQTQFDSAGLKINVEENLILRFNHNEPNTEHDFDQRFLVVPHLDTSILTTWVWASHPGATLYQDRKGNHAENVEDLHDQNSEYCIIPGMDYCDFSSSMKTGTWHGVRNSYTGQHRVGIVGFLRQS